jgi:hypothetical protein
MPTPTSIVNAVLNLLVQDATVTSGTGANIVSRIVPGLSYPSSVQVTSNFFYAVPLTLTTIIPSTAKAFVVYVRNVTGPTMTLQMAFGTSSTVTGFLDQGGIFLWIQPTAQPANDFSYVTNLSVESLAGNPATIEYLWAQ